MAGIVGIAPTKMVPKHPCPPTKYEKNPHLPPYQIKMFGVTPFAFFDNFPCPPLLEGVPAM